MFILKLEHEGLVIFFVAELWFTIVLRFHFVAGKFGSEVIN